MPNHVNFECPKCGGNDINAVVESGDNVSSYFCDSVPIEIGFELKNTTITCSDCKQEFLILEGEKLNYMNLELAFL